MKFSGMELNYLWWFRLTWGEGQYLTLGVVVPARYSWAITCTTAHCGGVVHIPLPQHSHTQNGRVFPRSWLMHCVLYLLKLYFRSWNDYFRLIFNSYITANRLSKVRNKVYLPSSGLIMVIFTLTWAPTAALDFPLLLGWVSHTYKNSIGSFSLSSTIPTEQVLTLKKKKVTKSS